MELSELNMQWLIIDENTISEEDYIIWADDKIEIPVNTNTKRFFYNQWTKRSPSTSRSCWPFWSIWTVSDLTWIEVTEVELNEINQLAIDEFWLTIPGWMYMSKAVDCVRTWWNRKNPNNKLYSIRCDIWDKVFTEALQKWHSLVVWYKTSTEYYKDSQDDWIVIWEDFPINWWHLVRTNFNDKAIKIDDNYFWTKKYNTYINNRIKILKDKWIFFPSAYLFLYEKTMTDKIRDNIDLENAKKFFDRGFTNWLKPRESITRQEFWASMELVIQSLQK